MMKRLVLPLAATTLAAADGLPNVTLEAAGGRVYVNNYNAHNPLNIKVAAAREDNYFIILGDWGKSDGPGPCQVAVAEKIKTYVKEQSAAGKNLLFIATVGDNFYWSGVKPYSWELSWEAPYGPNDPDSPLFEVPWLATLGNHDYGDNDPWACCPNAQAEAMAVAGAQAYGSQQLNADKNPKRPASTKRYWLPDYNYHYVLPEADLEVISVDTNFFHMHELGGEPAGHMESFSGCGGGEVARGFMATVAKAGQELLKERAAKGYVKTVVILQHYPKLCQKDIFYDALPDWRKASTKVLCAYGHIHEQKCEGTDADGNCNVVLTGGGGGCCKPVIESAGFTAVSLTDTKDGGFKTEIGTPATVVPAAECAWMEFSFNSMTRQCLGAQ